MVMTTLIMQKQQQQLRYLQQQQVLKDQEALKKCLDFWSVKFQEKK